MKDIALAASPIDSLFTPAGDGLVIHDVDTMPPFLMSVVSASDHWLFVSSRGGVTLGRVEAGRALLPYETDDRLHACQHGPVTAVRVRDAAGREQLWTPFREHRRPGVRRRHLRKSIRGDWLEFEEVAHDLGLALRVRWTTSERFGFERRCSLRRLSGNGPITVTLVDGLTHVLPAGVDMALQNSMSCLVDAYKRAELHGDLGIFLLEAEISDSAAPAESMRANAVWHIGLPGDEVSLSETALARFLESGEWEEAPLVVGSRLSYLRRAELHISVDSPTHWRLVADVALDHVALSALRTRVASIKGHGLLTAIDADIAAGVRALDAVVASVDGIQCTGDRRASTAHYANALFNAMRGGRFLASIPKHVLSPFILSRNRQIAARHGETLTDLPAQMHIGALLKRADATDDPDLRRLCREVLPLSFSRRHGDPSRPWNRFHIRLHDEEGAPLLAYQGNWRDIFQNWEALCRSHPDYLESVVAKFVNATTRDGHNPYRISEAGIDWEVPEPDSPWSNIGYWGDHQIAYLLRLLEALEQHRPGRIAALLDDAIFSFANVPYRIAPFEQLLRDPRTTITFDRPLDRAITARVKKEGADGRLVWDEGGQVVHATLAEKLLLPALAKLSNLAADGGIWLNTQRPEWNDANNALSGYGLSMVTLCYLRSYLAFCRARFDEGPETLQLSPPALKWLKAVRDGLVQHQDATKDRTTPALRRALLDLLGQAYGDYREATYGDLEATSFKTEDVAASAVMGLCDVALLWCDRAIARNRRQDGLLHGYNVLELDDDSADVGRLPKMLEGQVALLSSGTLDAKATVALIDACLDSDLYRADQQTFMLYPVQPRLSFFERNVLPARYLVGSPLLSALAAAEDVRLLRRDAAGALRFSPELTNAAALDAALDALATSSQWRSLVEDGRPAAHRAYESVFQHAAFTGRSGTMHKYEGIGCIYWHQVTKLVLAVQAAFFAAHRAGDAAAGALAERYHLLQRGLGAHKAPEVFGAFPTDPYSHSPLHLGAQQPGMTGQVKEGVLCRLGELGVQVRDGKLGFVPALLRRSDFLAESTVWRIVGQNGVSTGHTLPVGGLGFTVCGVPVLYKLGGAELRGTLTLSDGHEELMTGATLSREQSAEVFARKLDGTQRVVAIRIDVPEAALIRP